MTDWTEYQDDISDAISDSMDMDWSANDGARAVVHWLNENAAMTGREAETLALRTLLDNLVIAQGLSKEIREHATSAARSYLYNTRAMLSAAPQPAAPSSLAGGSITGISLDGQQGEPAGMMTVKAHLSDGSEVVLIRDNGNIISHHKNLAALSPEAPEREGDEDAELSVLDREAIDRSFRTVQAYDAVRLLQAALLDTMKCQHTGYDWNADPDQMTLKQGNALALATKVFSDLNAAVDAHDDFTDADWEEALTPRHEAPAEGAGERGAIAREVWIGFTGNPNAWDRAKNTANETVKYCWSSADRILAFRARSSAPEAREDAWTPFELKPNDIANIIDRHADCGDEGLHNASQLAEMIYAAGQEYRTHPDPDALRVAVEALEGSLPQLEVLHSIVSGKETRAIVWREITKGRQALAALQAEQKGGA